MHKLDAFSPSSICFRHHPGRGVCLPGANLVGGRV
jgi:hypothetical protein